MTLVGICYGASDQEEEVDEAFYGKDCLGRSWNLPLWRLTWILSIVGGIPEVPSNSNESAIL